MSGEVLSSDTMFLRRDERPVDTHSSGQTPNDLLRAARLAMLSPSGSGRPMSRQELAEKVNAHLWKTGDPDAALDETDIGRLERGETRWPRRLRREAFRSVLHAANDTELGFYVNRRARSRSGQAMSAEPVAATEEVIVVDVVIDGHVRAVPISRRKLFEALAAGLTAPILSDSVNLRGRIDPALVDHFAALRALLVVSDNRLGPASVMSTVRHQLGLIAEARRQTVGNLRISLLGTQARWAEFAGWLCDDLGQQPEGEWWLNQALSLSIEADDVDFSAYALARSAQRAAATHDHDRVLDLAQAAARTGTAHHRVLAFAALQRAHGHAITGATHRFQAAIDDARALANAHAAAADDLGSFCTAPYVDVQEAEGWLRLGQPGTAAHRFGQALASWPAPFERDRGIYLSRAAVAYLADGRPDESAAAAMEALMLAETTKSVRIRNEVRSVALQIAEFRTRTPVAALLTALAADDPKVHT